MTDEILELDDEMPFGKYKGWELINILDEDEDYLRWFMANVTDVSLDSMIQDALANEALRQELIAGNY